MSSFSDVLIVGGGPVGLITAHALSQTLPASSIRVIDTLPKSSRDAYGRAITLFPRSSELLDQLGLAEDLAQECFACRDTVSYDSHGNEVQGRGWAFMESMGRGKEGKDTAWDFALVLRQKYQEDIFRQKLARKGILLEGGVECVDIAIHEKEVQGGYRIHATLLHKDRGRKEKVRCRYLIGADGGRSFIRRAARIPFDGSSSEDKWVRVDGVIETNLPKPRTYCAIESPTHGNVLWAALDHGATRIGYAFTAERQKAYKDFDEEAGVKEAIASVKPFNLKFKQVDWWTIYVVGQRIARSFLTKSCLFLAGDACHTHSSGAAQGMNTGIHDAVNLGWKLALVLRGLAKPELLRTYETDRKPNVQKLIDYDKDISRLMSMQLPLNWKGDPKADPNVVLGEVMKEAATFSSGLGISYAIDGVLSVRGSWPTSASIDAGAIGPGMRVPDVEIQRPGTFATTRLHKEMPNQARFYVLTFVGVTSVTEPHYSDFFTTAGSSKVLSSQVAAETISFITIIPQTAPSPSELLGLQPPGRVFFDGTNAAHARFGVGATEGAVVVARPDGWVGTSAVLGKEAVGELEKYFERFLRLDYVSSGLWTRAKL
ncbi:3-propionate hydroxylase [Aulographum hederae CBS 113979]|uniref:3-propionate hydroxylase n=1 Tax=Aulographum hederae CBS 113979 TaxID=1176131 RepID=A0A6G1HCG4_9PEZI|nr:3-propionate hydroxylase [Aulographum hederae CBS 113979]